jgi:dihydropteroate synthase
MTSMARPRIMGVVNVTPDSFSDGGLYLDPEAAIAHGRELLEEGADTSKAEVAAAAIDAGATIVNDVTGLGDPEMAPLCAERGVELIVMHMQGTPRTMQESPTYDDVVDDVRAFLAERIETAVAAGVDRSKVWVDPGIGFGKTLDHNLELIKRLGELRELGCPVLLGASRKSFLGKLTGSPVEERLGGSIAAAVLGVQAGADAVRVHDVAATRDALMVLDAVESAGATGYGPPGASL